MNARDTLKINDNGHLVIGGCDTVELAARFKTPLYVFDRAHFEGLCKVFDNAVKKYYGDGKIAYASKAFACTAVYKIIANLGLSADVVSGGELYLALKAGLDASKLFFHGNAKTDDEIDYAVSSKVGAIVLESFDEVDKISNAAKTYGNVQGVMIRVNPAVEAHTHSFVQTAKTDSKFGIQLDSPALIQLIKKIVSDKNLKFLGLHTHIGSQIFDITPYKITLQKVVEYIKFLKKEGISVERLNLGGGFGITYTDADPAFCAATYEGFIKDISTTLCNLVTESNIKKPTLIFEPGRSLVGEAGITLYTVCAIKDIEGVRKYVSVDGGMFDNPRYALYGAHYEAIVASRGNDKKTEKVTVAGKCCESGDLITADVMMQPAEIGDIIAVLSTGAYNYSMASNYNCNAVPPVVMVSAGRADYIVKPQTYEDIARNNVIPDNL